MDRRHFVGLLASGLATRGWADAPLTQIRPVARPAVARQGTLVGDASDLITKAKLGGHSSYALLDLKSGQVIEAIDPARPMPPASTAKAITSLYALEHLGAGYRFTTRLIATGPLKDRVIAGDLVLAGGGDPTLTTDRLAEMAYALAKLGVRGIQGRFLVWGGALPYVREIDPDQPDWLGYNPAVAGLNLNFNRVNFTWKREGQGYSVGMNAEDRRFVPPVTVARVRLAERDLPVYAYDEKGGFEDWSVSRQALGGGGSRWLPVRHPDLYAGDVFRALAAGAGMKLPAPEQTATAPRGTVLVESGSDDLTEVLRQMMRYSTNMTAEAVGMSASLRRGVAQHDASGREMSDWLADRSGVKGARFVDHSGLGGASRISAEAMAGALARLGPGARLAALMKDVGVEQDGQKLPATVKAKTGTLNFVSALTGYFTAPNGRELVFAILSADTKRRDALSEGERERPKGGKAWVKRARALQHELIARWSKVHGA
ncbi:D-alanyl-D-alanine carboxypeptidase/D-alanyl-D-alanine-endopeptidase [Albidovulum sediminicola]|uniref:D-alanyl-D-alanine carboxypeptidase n=1 Tax=Albidovulum sediminicola TaxID=2984331 RepID=A0ABT2Z5A5_9RHOB|nr:D-alanyl-D-alanine carboxypeptidase [Defluviimonas sp. WL0075]MCV2866182.1 D-alanyl-D-alanine carboxypeptidase [Defluviimonas sp. WL0075]